MKIIKRNSDGVVIYASEDLTLTAQRATGGDWTDPGTTTANATLVQDVDLPADFVGGHYTYEIGAFARTDDGLEAAAAVGMRVRIEGATKIDDAVSAAYGRFTRFALEYAEREAQALAFRAADYTGPVPIRVAEFATPAGKTPQEAADLVLAQATQLRAAQSLLSGLRMRKHEVLRAPSDASAQASLDSILASIRTISNQLG